MYSGCCTLKIEFAKVSGVYAASSTEYETSFLHAENKGADQMCRKSAAEQHSCFLYIVQFLYFINPKFLAYSHRVVQPGLCRTGSEIPNTGFVMTGLK